jgi:glutathione S-transferase
MGTVPAAVDGDLHIFESNAILQYAADVDNVNDKYPKDPKTRARVNSWLLWEASVWFPSCYVYLFEYIVRPLLKQEPVQSNVDAEAPKWNKLAGFLDDQLSKTKWLAGNELTIADISVAASMHLHAAQCIPLDKHPNLKRWMIDGIENLPFWQKTQDAVNKALLPGTAA